MNGMKYNGKIEIRGTWAKTHNPGKNINSES
jgi:hypothetical protein